MNPVQVATPTPAALRIGLEAGGRQPADPRRWQLGISYDPDFDDLGGQFPAEPCLDDRELVEALDPGTLIKGSSEGQTEAVFWPYTLHLPERCSTMSGLGGDYFRPKLRAQLEVQTSRLLEQTFSTGLITVSDTEVYSFADLGYPNRPLEDPAATVVAGGPYGVVEAISLLVDAMADTLGSARGMVHVPHFFLPYLDYYSQIIRNPSDGRFISLLSHDHTVIAGTGYDGGAPDGSAPIAGQAWIYGTSPVEVRKDEIEVLPPMDEDAYEFRQNDVEYRAERLALASWDLSTHVAVQVAIPDPGPATGS